MNYFYEAECKNIVLQNTVWHTGYCIITAKGLSIQVYLINLNANFLTHIFIMKTLVTRSPSKIILQIIFCNHHDPQGIIHLQL